MSGQKKSNEQIANTRQRSQRERPDLQYWKTLHKKLNPGPGETKRGIPADYAGNDPRLCNARTKSGIPCRALGLEPSGRCKWHGGMSTGPTTPEGKAASAQNLRARRKLKNWVVTELEKLGQLPIAPTSRTPARTRE